MKNAIIDETGFYRIPGLKLTQKCIHTQYGKAEVFFGEDEWSDLVFLPRHGPDHQFPPHRINFRANMKAMKQSGIERTLAIFTVGSLKENIPPRSLVALDQFIDFTHGHDSTFCDGEESGLVHSVLINPFCPALREQLLQEAPGHQ